LLLVTAHVKVCRLAYDISKPYGQDRPVRFLFVKIFCCYVYFASKETRKHAVLTTKSGSFRNSMQNVGKYCGGEKILSPPWFLHCGGERPRRSNTSARYSLPPSPLPPSSTHRLSTLALTRRYRQPRTYPGFFFAGGGTSRVPTFVDHTLFIMYVRT